MGHSIKAIILKGGYDKQIAKEYDLIGFDLGYELTLFHINHYYSAYWQEKLKTNGLLDFNAVTDILFPGEYVIFELMKKISKNHLTSFALISTEYFGGIGGQYANVYLEDKIADKNIKRINEALAFFGVNKKDNLDEFDTVGLSNYRSAPEYLNKYVDLADELGV